MRSSSLAFSLYRALEGRRAAGEGKPLRKAAACPSTGSPIGPRSRLVAQIGPNRAISGRILTLLAGSETRRIWHQQAERATLVALSSERLGGSRSIQLSYRGRRRRIRRSHAVVAGLRAADFDDLVRLRSRSPALPCLTRCV